MRLLAWQRIPAMETPFGQHGCQRRSGIHSVPDGVLASSNLFGPSFYAHRAAAICKPPVIAFVILLFLISRPSAIIRRIAFLVVNAINGVFLARWLSHISKKVLKTVPPAFAHANPFGTIFQIPWISAVIASRNHPSPDSIDSGLAHIMCGISGDEHGSFLVNVETST